MPKDELEIFDEVEETDYVDSGEGDVTVNTTDEELNEEETPQSEDFSERGRDTADVEDVDGATVVKISKRALLSLFKSIRILDERTKKMQRENLYLKKEMTAMKKSMSVKPRTAAPAPQEQRRVQPIGKDAPVNRAPSARPPVSSMYRGINTEEMKKRAKVADELDSKIDIGYGTDVKAQVKKIMKMVETEGDVK
jgi:hypothetical protein